MRHPLFGSQSAYDTFKHYLKEIEKEIVAKESDYVLNVNVDNWREYFINKYDFIPLSVFTDKATISLNGKGFREVESRRGDTYNVDEYRIEIRVPFTGYSFLFCLRPSSSFMHYPYVETPTGDSGEITFIYSMTTHDINEFESSKRKFFNALNTNVNHMNKDLINFKRDVISTFNNFYVIRRERAIAEKSFFEKMNISINTNTDKIYKVPVIEKKIIPEPVIDKKTTKFTTDVPTIDDKVYDDILDIINTFFKSVEKKPSTYSVLDEEGLRDYVLPVLETRYNNTTVTGETFNKGGKTDILVKYKDGTNLFIAECKFWKGEAIIVETINQLFDRYLTWRDSKVAVIFFVKNKEFSKVLEIIKKAIQTHPYFVRIQGSRGESSFSYIFHFPTDVGKFIFLEVMAFHFP